MNNEKMSSEITEEGAINLARAILVFTYKDYYRALRQMKKWSKVHNELQPIENTWVKFKDDKKRYNALKNRKLFLTEEEIKFRKNFPHRVAPRRLTKKEATQLAKYNNAYAIACECEYFYRSANFKLYTLNADIDPEEVIMRIKEDAEYDGK